MYLNKTLERTDVFLDKGINLFSLKFRPRVLNIYFILLLIFFWVSGIIDFFVKKAHLMLKIPWPRPWQLPTPSSVKSYNIINRQ